MLCTQPRRLLIADDETIFAEALVEALTHILESLGERYIIETAQNGNEALVKLQQDRYNLLITDYHMPGMTGLALAQAASQVSPSTRILLMSGCMPTLAYDTSQPRNLVGYLHKPFGLSELQDAVKHVV